MVIKKVSDEKLQERVKTGKFFGSLSVIVGTSFALVGLSIHILLIVGLVLLILGSTLIMVNKLDRQSLELRELYREIEEVKK